MKIPMSFDTLRAAETLESVGFEAIFTWRIVLAMGAFAALVRFLP